MGPSTDVTTAAPLVRPGRVEAWLRLGRVSNLPTVWTNTLAAVTLCGETVAPLTALVCMASMSVFYVAGMILNDAFDADYDVTNRPSRPIPSGVVSKSSAFGVGFAGLSTAVAVIGMVAHQLDGRVLEAVGLAAALGAVIVGYDAYHKRNPLSPVLMGACRALVYLTTALAASSQLSAAVITASCLQWSYIIGLTYAAKQEDLVRPGAFWPVLFVVTAPAAVAASMFGVSVPLLVSPGASLFATGVAVAIMAGSIGYGLAPLLQSPRRIGIAIGRLIAGVAVLDAMLIATTGWLWGVVLALLGAALTRLGQRYVSGT